MAYELQCDCSEILYVDIGDAGNQITCHCGRAMNVPRLSTLRAMSSEAGAQVSADFEIGTLLAHNLLPFETCCFECAAATTNCLVVQVVCERAIVIHAKFSWFAILSVFLSPFLGFFFWRGRRPIPKEIGKDKIYSLPVRICPGCLERIDTSRELPRVLGLIPLYARLLAKYPKARLR